MKSKIEKTEKTEKTDIGLAQFLLHINHQIACSKSLDDALNCLLNITTKAIKAERGSIFLNDEKTQELYASTMIGKTKKEIRFLNKTGIAGWCFSHKKSLVIPDVSKDKRFNSDIDTMTGYKTQNILCVPIFTHKKNIIGVVEILNKKQGPFTKDDIALLSAMCEQASVVIQQYMTVNDIEKNRASEKEMLKVISSVSTELQLGPLLQKLMKTITELLQAERSTLFLNDEKTKELYTEIGEGLGSTKIRFPNHLGIAGEVFTSGKSIHIPYAYADLRFNPAIDKQTGYFTRSILCTPVKNKKGNIIGVTQVLNKIGGGFTQEDEEKLIAFTSQVAIGLENAKLFDDVQNMKNYNESILHSMKNTVITLDEEKNIVTCNDSGLKLFGINESDIIKKPISKLIKKENKWILSILKTVIKTQEDNIIMDEEIVINGEPHSVNITIHPLSNSKKESLGTMIMIEDFSTEKRMKSTMSRYMDASLTDTLMDAENDILGGTKSQATVLFSDIRSFTTITETLGAEGTVQLLNEYFSVMVDCIQSEGGMLDKFIGDAMMAIFGTPFPHEDDEDRGVRTAIQMMVKLSGINTTLESKGFPPIMHGIGLNSDEIVSGNIGSPKRMDYTVIGDGVNLAARLESACKQYGANIIISENTFNKLKETYRTRKIDHVIVKGKTEPVSIYEVLDFHTPESFPNIVDVLSYFRDGMDLFQKGNFKKALSQFKSALKLNSEDKCSQMYVDRCNVLIKKPPKGKWNGVWIMTSK